MDTFHPQSPDQFAQRNKLLQQSLRPEPLPFAIENEYPLVLSHEGREFSYCVANEGNIIAHFNLWPRLLIHHQEHFRVGLVGNVATDQVLRGQGVMSRCFHQLDKIAEQQGLQALILWSDLHSFYQKQGYAALGKEMRFTFNSSGEKIADDFLPIAPSSIDEALACKLLALRPPLAGTLQRSAQEMVELLQIPETHLFVKTRNGDPIGYAVVGKGYDMAGVVHEWGIENADDLASLAQRICSYFGWPASMVLSPGGIDAQWAEALKKRADSWEVHPMALVKTKNSAVGRCLSESFIWGLDSI